MRLMMAFSLDSMECELIGPCAFGFFRLRSVQHLAWFLFGVG